MFTIVLCRAPVCYLLCRPTYFKRVLIGYVHSTCGFLSLSASHLENYCRYLFLLGNYIVLHVTCVNCWFVCLMFVAAHREFRCSVVSELCQLHLCKVIVLPRGKSRIKYSRWHVSVTYFKLHCVSKKSSPFCFSQ